MSFISRWFGGSSPEPERIEDPDDVILQALRNAGIDLEAEHRLDFFLYFPGATEANAALKDATRDGYRGELHPPPDTDGDWMMILHRTMVPARAAIKATRAHLEALAEEHEGEFEGWDDATTS